MEPVHDDKYATAERTKQPFPQEIYFSWNDIMKFEGSDDLKEPEQLSGISERHHLPPPQNRGDFLEGDLEDWIWEECEYAQSPVLSSALPSSDYSVPIPLGKEQEDNEDSLWFPSYDDAAFARVVENKPVDEFSPSGIEPESPDPVYRAKDDTELQFQPPWHVDYLSHNWCEDDLRLSWKHVVSKRSSYRNGPRLQNALWRYWVKMRHNLKTMAPECLMWSKDCDITSLYGPVQYGSVTAFKKANSYHSAYYSDAKPNSQVVPQKKSILKKQSILETILHYPYAWSSLLTQSDGAVQTPESEQRTSPDPVAVSSKPKNVRCHSLSLSSTSFSAKKNVRFQDEVDQIFVAGTTNGHKEDNDMKAEKDWITTECSYNIPCRTFPSPAERTMPEVVLPIQEVRGLDQPVTRLKSQMETKILADMVPDASLTDGVDLGVKTALLEDNVFWNPERSSPHTWQERLSLSRLCDHFCPPYREGDGLDEDEYVEWMS